MGTPKSPDVMYFVHLMGHCAPMNIAFDRREDRDALMDKIVAAVEAYRPEKDMMPIILLDFLDGYGRRHFVNLAAYHFSTSDTEVNAILTAAGKHATELAEQTFDISTQMGIGTRKQ